MSGACRSVKCYVALTQNRVQDTFVDHSGRLRRHHRLFAQSPPLRERPATTATPREWVLYAGAFLHRLPSIRPPATPRSRRRPPAWPQKVPATQRARGSTASQAPRDPSETTRLQLYPLVPTSVLLPRASTPRSLPDPSARYLALVPVCCDHRRTPSGVHPARPSAALGSDRAARALSPCLSCRVPSRHDRLPATPPTQEDER